MQGLFTQFWLNVYKNFKAFVFELARKMNSLVVENKALFLFSGEPFRYVIHFALKLIDFIANV